MFLICLILTLVFILFSSILKIEDQKEKIFDLEEKEFLSKLKKILPNNDLKIFSYPSLCYGKQKEDILCISLDEEYYLSSFYFKEKFFNTPFVIFEVDNHWYQDGCDEIFNLEKFDNLEDCLERIKNLKNHKKHKHFKSKKI